MDRKSTQAHIDANARYDKKAYARVLLRVRNDNEMNLDAIRAHIAETGESLNGFIMRAIAETIERDTQQNAKEPAEGSFYTRKFDCRWYFPKIFPKNY